MEPINPNQVKPIVDTKPENAGTLARNDAKPMLFEAKKEDEMIASIETETAGTIASIDAETAGTIASAASETAGTIACASVSTATSSSASSGASGGGGSFSATA